MKGIPQTDRKWFNFKKRKEILEHKKENTERKETQAHNTINYPFLTSFVSVVYCCLVSK